MIALHKIVHRSKILWTIFFMYYKYTKSNSKSHKIERVAKGGYENAKNRRTMDFSRNLIR